MDIKFENTLVPVHSRRLAIIATEEKLIEIKKKIWDNRLFQRCIQSF